MSTDQSRPANPKPSAAPPAAAVKNPPPPGRPAPLFRRLDWLAFLVTFAAVWIGYYLTLAPEQTLEDSGELATGSFYAGIPHPPGYPVWTIYTWLWTVLLPVGNIAWRVALGEATSGALAAGLLGLLVSRGSSLLIEGIEELRGIVGRWESAICMVSGFVAGMLLGFNGFMWSQSVIVEVYSFGVASLMVVLLCLMRWIYAPHQRRYLYYALFFHGICFTNHQTLIVAALGIEVAIAAADLRLGRNLFLGNTIVYLCGLILKQQHILTALEANPAVFAIFNVVGLCSIAAYCWFAYLTRETFTEFCFDTCWTALWLLLAAAFALGGFYWVLALAALVGVIKFGWDTRKLGLEWLIVLGLGGCWIAGAALYFYMPLAGMTNPPMEWGYPRTVDGFIHAFTRGQYEKATPSDVIHDPLRFIMQLGILGNGIGEEFNWVYCFLALVPFLFFFKLHKRERAWLIGLTAIYFCLGVILLIMLNPSPDRASLELNRVFFTASHTVVAMLVGYGLTLVAAYMATHYQRFRSWGLTGGLVAVALALYCFAKLTTETYFGLDAAASPSQLASLTLRTFTNKDQYGLPVFAGLILIGMTVVYVGSLWLYRHRAPLAVTLFIFALMPAYSIMTHWSDNEERGHWFGYWFGHDMFTPPFKGSDGKPLYPEMTKDAVLFGGTDPGRFCPTYAIFCDSFLPPRCQPAADPNFDRRDVYIITQNALADGTYLNYIRAQFNRSAQIDPPFFQELFRSAVEREQNYTTNLLARAVIPLDCLFLDLGDRVEKRRRTFTSWFDDKSFTDLPGFATRLRPGPEQDPVSKYLYDNLSPETQKLLAGPTKGDDLPLRRALTKDLNWLLERELEARKLIASKTAEKSALLQDQDPSTLSPATNARLQRLDTELAELSRIGPLCEPDRFKQAHLSEYLQDFIKQNPRSHTRIRLNRLLLEAAYPKEIASTKGGVYPDREIYTPSPEDSQNCFSEYLAGAQQRLQHDTQFPNEPRQIRPGEDVRFIENRVQVSGQVAVMAINGLLTKVIFDHNPKNEFFVEESFPLEWMYPYQTPFGIIMKINRQKVPELTEDIVRRDHEFWSQYSARLIGNWITYDTPLKDIAAFVEKVYLRRDFTGFKGDCAFIRDDQAQKAFSKLRSSIGGVYVYRISDPANRSPAVQQRMIKEADFALRQSFAFCPYSPEAVVRYVTLLTSLNRFDDALIVATTARKLDPNNGQFIDLVKRLGSVKGAAPQASLEQLEKAFRDNPADFQSALNLVQAYLSLQRTDSALQVLDQARKALGNDPANFQNAFNLASTYLTLQQTNSALQVLDLVLNSPRAEPGAWRALLQAYASIGQTSKTSVVMAKLEPRFRANPSDFNAAFGLIEGYRDLQRNDLALPILDQVLNDPKLDAAGALQAAQNYAALANYPKLEVSLEKLVTLSPESPEAWYDLAALRASLGKSPAAMDSLRHSIELSAKRRLQNPAARDMAAEARKDPRFTTIRGRPDFQQLTAPK